MGVKPRIKLLAFENGIISYGLRRISSATKEVYPETTTYIYDLKFDTAKVSFNRIKKSSANEQTIRLNEQLIQELAETDIIGISCVSFFSEYAIKLIEELRKTNKQAIIVWGGIHATVFPEDAIKYADAICIGEGEKSFLSFLKRIEAGDDYSDAKGFWIRKGDTIIKNQLLPLMTNDELETMPFQDYGFDIKYVTHDSIEYMTKDIYVARNGSFYLTMWSFGCPYGCAYCSNNVLINYNRDYAKVRHPSPDYIVKELVWIKKAHDYVRYVSLVDDNISVISAEILERFSQLWQEQVNLPMFIPGFHPSTVKKDKVAILVQAGMKKVRMGIQSGSDKILAFYGRKTTPEKIIKASEILASFYPRINPPEYDIIIDNPLETEQDKEDTLALVRSLKRPLMINCYSLRYFPGTKLHDYAIEHPELEFKPYNELFSYSYDKYMTTMVYCLSLFNLPDILYNLIRRIAKNDRLNNLSVTVFKLSYILKRLWYELRASNTHFLSGISPRLTRTITYLLSKK
ncbi:MAG: radical SAM protein [Oryzomonas sp.]